MKIEDIIDAIRHNRIRITDHAYDEAEEDEISFDEIFASALRGEIIENYPDDMPYPSCLIYGVGFDNAPIHSVWAFNDENRWAVLITTYRPNPRRWVDWRVRRPK